MPSSPPCVRHRRVCLASWCLQRRDAVYQPLRWIPLPPQECRHLYQSGGGRAGAGSSPPSCPCHPAEPASARVRLPQRPQRPQAWLDHHLLAWICCRWAERLQRWDQAACGVRGWVFFVFFGSTVRSMKYHQSTLKTSLSFFLLLHINTDSSSYLSKRCWQAPQERNWTQRATK